MQINSPEEFVKAVNASLMYMNKEQRIAFVRWIKERVQQYNFNYPQGYKENNNAVNTSDEQPVNNSPSDSSVVQHPDIVEATVCDSNEGGTTEDSGHKDQA